MPAKWKAEHRLGPQAAAEQKALPSQALIAGKAAAKAEGMDGNA